MGKSLLWLNALLNIEVEAGSEKVGKVVKLGCSRSGLGDTASGIADASL